MTKIIVGGYEVEANGFEYLMSNGNELQIVSLDSRPSSVPELNAVMEGKKNVYGSCNVVKRVVVARG